MTVPFLDVSKYQGNIRWQDVMNFQFEGQYVRGAIVRAIDRYQAIDPMLRINLDGIHATGRLWAGAYHDLVNDSVTAQFARFRNAVPDWLGIIPMVDSEYGASFRQLEEFMELAKLEWGKYPLVYLPRWYWAGLVDKGSLHPEWTWVHSHYNDPNPGPLIPPLTSLKGHVWQYSSLGKVPGITENTVDLNRFYGDETELLRLAVQ